MMEYLIAKNYMDQKHVAFVVLEWEHAKMSSSEMRGLLRNVEVCGMSRFIRATTVSERIHESENLANVPDIFSR